MEHNKAVMNVTLAVAEMTRGIDNLIGLSIRHGSEVEECLDYLLGTPEYLGTIEALTPANARDGLWIHKLQPPEVNYQLSSTSGAWGRKWQIELAPGEFRDLPDEEMRHWALTNDEDTKPWPMGSGYKRGILRVIRALCKMPNLAQRSCLIMHMEKLLAEDASIAKLIDIERDIDL